MLSRKHPFHRSRGTGCAQNALELRLQWLKDKSITLKANALQYKAKAKDTYPKAKTGI